MELEVVGLRLGGVFFARSLGFDGAFQFAVFVLVFHGLGDLLGKDAVALLCLAPLPSGNYARQKDEQGNDSDDCARRFRTASGLALLLDFALLLLRPIAGSIKMRLVLHLLFVKLLLELVVALQVVVGVGQAVLRLGCLGALKQHLGVILVQRVVSQTLLHCVVDG